MYRDNVLYALGRDRFNQWTAHETQISVAQQERLIRFFRRPRLKDDTTITTRKAFLAEILYHELSAFESVYDFSLHLNVGGEVYEVDWHKPYAEKRYKQYDRGYVRPPKPAPQPHVELFCNFQNVPLLSYSTATKLSINAVTPKLVQQLDKRTGLYELPSVDDRIWLLKAPLEVKMPC